MVLAAAMLTRYDGWVLAFVIGCAAVAVVWRTVPAKRFAASGARWRPLFCYARSPPRSGWRTTTPSTTSRWIGGMGHIRRKPLNSATGMTIPIRASKPGACGQAVSESCAAEFFQRLRRAADRRLWPRC